MLFKHLFTCEPLVNKMTGINIESLHHFLKGRHSGLTLFEFQRPLFGKAAKLLDIILRIPRILTIHHKLLMIDKLQRIYFSNSFVNLVHRELLILVAVYYSSHVC